MTDLNKKIISTLLFYDLLDYPLTPVEIFRYLFAPEDRKNKDERIGLLDIAQNAPQKALSENGFYFLKDREKLTRQRIQREKVAVQKWKKLKKTCSLLQSIPYVRGVGATGSLTLYNTKPESDFDFLIIVKPGRIWTARALVSVFLSLIGQKRHGLKIKDKICLNCFTTEESLNFKPEVRPHNISEAQEYARVVPVLEIQKGLWKKFHEANKWIENYLFSSLWFESEFYCVPKIRLFGFIRTIGEKILNLNWWGDSVEKFLKKQQIKRIKKNLTNNTDDQIFFSDQYLLFHPHSKGLKLSKEFSRVVDNLH